MSVEAGPDRLAAWCGWCLAALLAVTPLMAWLGPLSYAPLAAIVGLLAAPAWRVDEEDRPLTIALLVLVIWACGSYVWSPYRPEDIEGATAVKLALQAPIYWALICAARRASPASRTWGLRLLAWGMAILGLVMLIEALTGAGIYREFRTLLNDPIRPDLARKNVAKGGVMLAILWAPAALAGWRVDRAGWLAAPMLAGLLASGVAFGADAPILGFAAGLVAGLGVLALPRNAPRALAVVAGLFFLLTPTLMDRFRAMGGFDALQKRVEASWSQRIGYWGHAVDWIGDHPMRGWGLDASRMFSPGIHLHPHDAALQIWLELGLIGAVAAAVFWAVLFVRMSSPKRDLATAVGATVAVAYLVFAAVSFGVWQEWWLALGAIAAAACLELRRQAQTPASGRTSTITP
jgi:O-antigen ligase